MRNKIGAIISAGVLVLAGCLPEPLPVGEIPQLKPQIVVSSQITSDRSVVIFLTKSVGALDASEDSDPDALLNTIAINDADVTIVRANITYPLVPLGNGIYSSVTEIPLVEDETYTLSVESPSMGNVTSTTIAKGVVNFDFLEASTYNNGYDTLAEVSFGFEDVPGKNYYMFNVQRLTGDFEAEDILNPEIYTQLIDDATFSGTTSYFARKRIPARRDFVPGDTVAILLSNISEEYYKFIELRQDARFNFADFLGEPANYPTNVKGGLGFFNLHIPDVRILRLE